jgi:hypothetical protein
MKRADVIKRLADRRDSTRATMEGETERIQGFNGDNDYDPTFCYLEGRLDAYTWAIDLLTEDKERKYY